MSPTITFLSDYGQADDFVGTCHGVMAGICPDARILDITHGISRHDARAGALVLRNTLPYFPAGVHLAVVDPEVGRDRRAVALRTAEEDRILVGPDNGLLSLAAERFGGVVEAADIGRSPWRLEPVSATFHGRDIFAPVAAHLALGEEPDGEIDPASLIRLERLVASEGAAIVLEVDGFGNLRLDAPAGTAAARVNGHDVVNAHTFSDVAPGKLVLYADSDGGLALAVNGGSAAAWLGVTAGDEVRFEPR